MDQRTLRNAFGCFPTGVTVVTAAPAGGKPVGITVSSFTSVSIEPPLVLWCLGRNSASFAEFEAADNFAINVLREDHKEHSILFASRAENKFDKIEFDTWETGAPVLKDCLTSMDCRKVATYDGGDHVIYLGEVLKLEYNPGGQPLVFFRSAYSQLGSNIL